MASSPLPSGQLERDFRSRFERRTRARFLSRGHGFERYSVDVWVNPAASAALKSASGEMPPGAVLLEEEFERTAEGDKPTGFMRMEKREPGQDQAHGDWRFTVLDASGRVDENARVELCATCHGQARKDYVFPIPE